MSRNPVPLTIIGAGAYGVQMVYGAVLAPGALPGVRLAAFVDPAPQTDLLRTGGAGSVPLFCSVASWREAMGPDLGAMIVDLAVPIAAVPSLVRECVAAGVRRFILPKPVTLDVAAFESLVALFDDAEATALVASNWFYSRLPAVVARTVADMGPSWRVRSAALQYSKFSRKRVPLPPLEAEVPHALQILACTGLWTPEDGTPRVVAGSAHSVSLACPSSQGLAEVSVLSATRHPAGRVRELHLVLADGADTVEVTGDFDVTYDWSTGRATRTGSVTVVHGPVGHRTRRRRMVPEHNLQTMYGALLPVLLGGAAAARRNPEALTLARYRPFQRCLADIGLAWASELDEELDDGEELDVKDGDRD